MLCMLSCVALPFQIRRTIQLTHLGLNKMVEIDADSVLNAFSE